MFIQADSGKSSISFLPEEGLSCIDTRAGLKGTVWVMIENRLRFQTKPKVERARAAFDKRKSLFHNPSDATLGKRGKEGIKVGWLGTA